MDRFWLTVFLEHSKEVLCTAIADMELGEASQVVFMRAGLELERAHASYIQMSQEILEAEWDEGDKGWSGID